MRSEPNDCIHALILGDLEHGDSRLLTTTTDRISPCLSKKLHRPKVSDLPDDDDTFRILNGSFHGKGKGGFAQIRKYRRQRDLCLILDSYSSTEMIKIQVNLYIFDRISPGLSKKVHRPAIHLRF